MSSYEPVETKEDKSASPAKQGRVRQNPQPGRNLGLADESPLEDAAPITCFSPWKGEGTSPELVRLGDLSGVWHSQRNA